MPLYPPLDLTEEEPPGGSFGLQRATVRLMPRERRIASVTPRPTVHLSSSSSPRPKLLRTLILLLLLASVVGAVVGYFYAEPLLNMVTPAPNGIAWSPQP